MQLHLTPLSFHGIFNISYSLTYTESCGKELKLPKTPKNDHFSKVCAFLRSDFDYKAKKKKELVTQLHVTLQECYRAQLSNVVGGVL